MTSIKRLSVLLCSLMCIAFMAGCATITNGPSQEVNIFSMPPGATVTIDGMPRGVTPISVVLRRKQSHYASFSKECYQTQQMPIDRQFQFGKWFFGNFFSWDLPGMIVDIASGSAWVFRPNPLHVTLKNDPGELCIGIDQVGLPAETPSSPLALLSTVTPGDANDAGKNSSSNAEAGKANGDTSLTAGSGSLLPTGITLKDPIKYHRDLYKQVASGAVSVAELDLIADSISSHRYLHDMDRQTEIALSWLCKALGKSGKGRYKIFLNEIADSKTLPPSTTRHAAAAAQSLPDNDGVLSDYHYNATATELKRR